MNLTTQTRRLQHEIHEKERNLLAEHMELQKVSVACHRILSYR
jgi:hypothetical protein